MKVCQVANTWNPLKDEENAVYLIVLHLNISLATACGYKVVEQTQ